MFCLQASNFGCSRGWTCGERDWTAVTFYYHRFINRSDWRVGRDEVEGYEVPPSFPLLSLFQPCTNKHFKPMVDVMWINSDSLKRFHCAVSQQKERGQVDLQQGPVLYFGYDSWWSAKRPLALVSSWKNGGKEREVANSYFWLSYYSAIIPFYDVLNKHYWFQ